MSLIKLCANRMTKELMAGNLKEPDIDRIRNFDQNHRDYYQNWQDTKINQRAKINSPNMLRSNDQIASGLQRGTDAITKKMGLDSYDLNNYSNAPAHVKDILSGKGSTWEDSISYSEMNMNGKIQKPFIAYDKSGNSLDAAIGGRHEMFEEQERLRIGRKIKVRGMFMPDVTETSIGNSNGKLSYRMNGNIHSSGNHNTLGVLGKESTEVSRLFNREQMGLHKLRTDNYHGRTEAKLLEGITGKKYGTKYGKKEFNILDKIKQNEHVQTSFFQPQEHFTDFDDAIKQGQKLRAKPSVKNFNVGKALATGVPLALMGGALAYGMHKYLKNRSNRPVVTTV